MVTAARPVPHTDSTAPEPTVNFSQARFVFRQLETWLTDADTNAASEADVEEQLQARGRELLRVLLQVHLRQRGTGQVGPALQVFTPPPPPATRTDASVAPSPPVVVRHGAQRLRPLTLHTTLGKVTVARTAHVASGQASIHPLDEQLQLPARSFSYPLQERLVRHAVQGPFDEAVDNVKLDTGISLSKRSAEQVVQEAARHFQAFYQQPHPPSRHDRSGADSA